MQGKVIIGRNETKRLKEINEENDSEKYFKKDSDGDFKLLLPPLVNFTLLL